MNFEKEYYETNNYKNYLSRGQRYAKLAREIDSFFDSMGLDFKNQPILDYGCAVGFLMQGFKQIGYNKIHGVEISNWARSVTESKGFTVFDPKNIPQQNLVFFLDVLEHIPEKEVDEILTNLKSNFVLVRIPVPLEDNAKFVLEISEKDPTHINRKCKKTWVKTFSKNNFDFFCYLNLHNIYDSEGVFCAIFKRKDFKLDELL
jgi:hypothetical protein